MSQTGGTDGTYSVRETGITVEADGFVAAFDAAGHVTRVYDGDVVYRRGLNNDVVAKWWEPTNVDGASVRLRRSRWVEPDRRDDLFERSYRLASAVLRDESDETTIDDAAGETVRRVLEGSPARLRAHAEGFDAVYDPIGVLPPDRYRAVVLQPVTGCPYDCSFCTLYDGTDVTMRSVDEFRSHVEDVRSFFGRALRSRRGVFLGDADPLTAPLDDLLEMLETVSTELPGPAVGGVGAFCTARTAARRGPEELASLADAGLDRLYLGIESGSPSVLEVLRKPQTIEEVETGVCAAKDAGLDVCLIVMAGVGGQELVAEHRRETTTLLESLSLAANDLVYVSPLAVDDTADYGRELQQRSLTAVDSTETVLEAERLRSTLAEVVSARVSQYHVSAFVYS